MFLVLLNILAWLVVLALIGVVLLFFVASFRFLVWDMWRFLFFHRKMQCPSCGATIRVWMKRQPCPKCKAMLQRQGDAWIVVAPTRAERIAGIQDRRVR